MLRDILLSGCIPNDVNLLKAEVRVPHRVLARRFVLDYIPHCSIGAALGVFTGLSSSLLVSEKKLLRVTFVDPWWKSFGHHYPDCGAYTDYGRVSTRKAFAVAKNRISRSVSPNRSSKSAPRTIPV
jgi:hypothetical protein